ncbi:MAG: DUF3352 domain-containing protein [Bacteroidales bacterium]|jgi:hypothetical protein
MVKKLLPYVLVLLIAVTAAVILFNKKETKETAWQSPAITVVPDDAVWILESRSVPDLLKALIQSDPLFPSLEQIGNITPLMRAFRKIDSLISRNSRFRDLYAKSPAVVSLHQTGKNQYQFLIIFETHGSAGISGAGDLFSELCGRPGEWSQRTYNGQQINRITFGPESQIPGVSLAENSKYMVLSPSPILIENAVRQMNKDRSLYNSPAFSKLAQTAGQSSLATIYVNLKAFPTWISSLVNPSLKRKLEMFTRYGDWASLDLSLRNDALWLNGFAVEGDTLNSYLNLFKNQEPQKLNAEEYLPSSTAAFYSIGVDKPAQFLKGLSDYLGGGEAGRKRKRMLDHAVAVMKTDIVKEWTELGFHELTIGYLCGVADETVRPVALIQVKSANQAKEKMLNPLNKSSKKIFKVDNQHEFEFYQALFDGLPEILGGSFFSAVAGKFFTFIGNFIVLADDQKTLEEVVHKYAMNKTLAFDAVYLSQSGLVTTRSNVTCYAIPYKARPLLNKIMNPKVLKAFFANEQFLLKTGAVGLQFQRSNGMSLHNIFASFVEIDYTKPQTIWESKLDARLFTKPAIVINHLTQDKEIIVQDEATYVYLISTSGRILWKKNIGERINSEIFQVDVMKNGRLQYLFSTVTGIHLLDRNGAYLPRYPVKFKLPATNGMALVDFDRTRDYRILIACSDNKVYAFDKNGKLLKGWNFGPASGAITRPVQYFKIQNKDFIVFTDPVKVYILDRKGTVKVNPEKDFPVSANNRIIFEAAVTGKGSKFLMTDVDGAVFSVFMDGTVESQQFGVFGPDHFFTVEDVNKDGLKEYIFVDRNKLEIFKQTGEKLALDKLDGPVSAPPDVFVMNDKMKKIGLTVPSKRQVLLFNGDGSIYQGFPLYGQTTFTIGNLEKSSTYQNLLVGSDEACLLNYAVK